jgi:hypothetical protein
LLLTTVNTVDTAALPSPTPGLLKMYSTENEKQFLLLLEPPGRASTVLEWIRAYHEAVLAHLRRNSWKGDKFSISRINVMIHPSESGIIVAK